MIQQELFKVRDLRKKDQYKIDDKYLNGYARIFGPPATAVYNSLSRHAEFHTQEAFPSEELIAKEHNISRKSVQRAIKQLRGANIIKIERVRRQGKWLNNMYYLVDREEWLKPEDIKDLWRPKRHWRRKPEDIKDKTIGLQSPIKDTHSKDNTYKDNTYGLAEPTTRKETKFNGDDYKKVIASYEELKGIKPQGQEYLPIQQAVKSMFMSGRSAESIIACMVWFKDKAASGDKKYVWTENWTIQTIKMKIAEFLAGKLGDKESIPPEYAKFWK